MSQTVPILAPVASVHRGDDISGGFATGVRFFAALAGFWAILLWNLEGYWSTIPQYSFGWLVPLLTVVLIAGRWKDRPGCDAPAYPGIAMGVMVVAALLVLPTWVLIQPNSDWRFVTWFLAFETLVLTFGMIYLGFGSRAVQHFLTPLLVFLTCVPWPFSIEWLVIQDLTRFVVGSAIDILNLLGVGALQHGNLIEVSSGSLDVTEACSGIRSLQSSLMVSVFLGEFYRLGVLKRIGLAVTGMAVAVVCNVVRATFIAYLAARKGMDVSADWHDSAGMTIMVICFICVWGVAVVLSRHETGAVRAPGTAGQGRISWRLSGLLGVWFLTVMVATEAWYWRHESKPAITWDFRWPQEMSGFRKSPLSDVTTEELQFDSGSWAEWQAADGTGRVAFFLKWKPGASRSRLPSRAHRPEVCLAAIGYTLDADLGMVNVTAAGTDIPFEHYVFEKDGVPVNVFFCVWQDHPRTEAGEVVPNWSRYAGFLFALEGQRRISQQMLEFAMYGPLSPEAALEKFRREMGGLIVN
jgi:exosortase